MYHPSSLWAAAKKENPLLKKPAFLCEPKPENNSAIEFNPKDPNGLGRNLITNENFSISDGPGEASSPSNGRK